MQVADSKKDDATGADRPIILGPTEALRLVRLSIVGNCEMITALPFEYEAGDIVPTKYIIFGGAYMAV